MLKFISNIQISRRLLLAFLLAAVIPGIVIFLLGFTFIQTQVDRSQAIQTNINAFKSTSAIGLKLPLLPETLDTAYQQQYVSNAASEQSQIQDNIKQLQGQVDSVDKDIQNYVQTYQLSTSPQMSHVRDILVNDDPNTMLLKQQDDALNNVQQKVWPAYKQAVKQAMDAISGKSNPEQVKTLVANADSKYADLDSAWDTVTQRTEEVNTKVARIGPTQTNPLLLGTLIAFLSTIIVVTAIGYVIYRTITVPLHQLAMLTRRIARGETNARANITGHDEIYLVANSMNNMLDNIVRLIQETQSQRDVLQGQVEKLVSEVSGVGEGDLRVEAEVTADALGVLADSFNYMVEELGSLVVRVKTVSAEVGNSTTAILERMTQLVETGNRQIKQIGDAAVEVENLTTSSRQVAERSQILYDVARVARQDAQIGRESVEQAVEGMGRINENVQETASKVQTLGERSREIDEIVEAISSIAHQTNRLALDAAIQAAMAGENGKGFGAVAADIRRLAERAKDQASMIGRIVRSVREDIGAVAISMQDTERETATGTRLTQEAGVALESIFAAVEHQAREIENINQVAMQQLQSTNTIVQIMHGVTESTQQSSQSTREASHNMERLSRLVEQLRSSVEAFKLREDHSYRIPDTAASITIDGEPENPLTVSGVFRTVSATLPPTQIPRPSLSGLTPSPEPTFTPMPAPTQQAAIGKQSWPGFPQQNNVNGQSWKPLPQSEEWSTENQNNSNNRNW